MAGSSAFGSKVLTIGESRSIVKKTSAYTLTVDDYAVLGDASAGAFSLTLPASPVDGQLYVVKKIDSSTNAVTVNGNGNNIEGAATLAITSQNVAYLIQYILADDVWYVQASFKHLHASTHQHGGSDEIASATAGANAIPKAGSGGKLDYGWLPLGSQLGISKKTTAYTATTTDHTLLGDTTGGAFSITLPASPVDGQVYVFKKIDSSSNTLTVDGNGNNIDGSATLGISARWTSYMIQYSSSEDAWFIL